MAKKGLSPKLEPISWPADKVERWLIDRLVPYARNARTHTDEQVDQVAASIREWGWSNPVLVGEDGGIIAGHCRVLAGKKLGLAEVPVMLAVGWSEAQKRAYVLADNQLTLNAGWNPELLRYELGELQDLQFDLGLIGFGDQLAALMDSNPGLTDPDEVPEPPAVPVTQRGDVWLLGRHRLVCGDATVAGDVVLALAGMAPHLMVTDPPYGVGYNPTWRDDAGQFGDGKTVMRGRIANDDQAGWVEAWNLFAGDVAYIWCASLTSDQAIDAIEASGLIRRSQIIWRKPHFQLSRGDYHWQHEPCWYVVRAGGTSHWTGDRTQATIWDIAGMNPAGRNRDAGNEKTGHGTQKPVECMKRPIENNSVGGDLVYDPFVGSGTTIIAAEMTGRACHALEISPIYCDVAVTRWENFTGQKAERKAAHADAA